MASSRAKTKFLAETTLLNLLQSGQARFFWTTTFADNPSKEEAERRLKPLRDLIHRREGFFCGVWEHQKRGALHLHWVTDTYLDVNFLRPWLIARGWGPIMRVERVQPCSPRWNGHAWVAETGEVVRLISYLGKYLTKTVDFSDGSKAKPFVCDHQVKSGTVSFKWVWWENPGSYLFAKGVEVWLRRFGDGAFKIWDHVNLIMRMGMQVTHWSDLDPWYEPPP